MTPIQKRLLPRAFLVAGAVQIGLFILVLIVAQFVSIHDDRLGWLYCLPILVGYLLFGLSQETTAIVALILQTLLIALIAYFIMRVRELQRPVTRIVGRTRDQRDTDTGGDGGQADSKFR